MIAGRALAVPPLVTLLCVISFAGCSSDDPVTALRVYDVEYSVTTSGAARVDSVTYDNGNGATTTERNPSLPWAFEFPAVPGDTVQASLSGSTGPEGVITLRVRATPNDAKAGVDSSRSCSDGEGVAGVDGPCRDPRTMVIPEETLP